MSTLLVFAYILTIHTSIHTGGRRRPAIGAAASSVHTVRTCSTHSVYVCTVCAVASQQAAQRIAGSAARTDRARRSQRRPRAGAAAVAPHPLACFGSVCITPHAGAAHVDEEKGEGEGQAAEG
eukprot:COSAG01_NODE_4577_length_4906_cov_91.659455_1_plen_123_part_00